MDERQARQAIRATKLQFMSAAYVSQTHRRHLRNAELKLLQATAARERGVRIPSALWRSIVSDAEKARGVEVRRVEKAAI